MARNINIFILRGDLYIMGRLFGTDGARGVANSELTCELAMNIGKAAAMVLTDSKNKHPKILIGKDTRISSDMLENALVAGLCSVGADVILLGVVPTPAVAYLVRKYNADAGIMISASHNPFEFNGIKIFSGSGYKLPDALENEIEAIVLDESEPYPCPTHDGIGSVTCSEKGAEDYIGRVSLQKIAPLPSIGSPKALTTLPSIASPTGTFTTLRVRLTISPSLISEVLERSAIETEFSSRFCAIPNSPPSNSRSSLDIQFSSPYAFAMPSPTITTVPTSAWSILSL